MAFIEFKDMTKEFGSGSTLVKANDEINFSIEEGEFVVILGPSGAGKTTLLNILGGMDSPTHGEVIVNQQHIEDYDDTELTAYRREHVGFVFQFYNLVPNLTAQENVELSSQIVDDSAEVEEVLERVGLGDRKDNFPAQLSGGEQQRVAIARALAKHPTLLLADEPTGALDNETGIQILDLLQEQATEHGRTVIVITHNQAISKMANHVIKIKDGIVADDYYQDDPKSVSEIEW